MIVGDTILRSGIEAIADVIAPITVRDGVFGIVQGSAETGPRARSIFANAANPRAPKLINERVKYRESIRSLTPMATLRAAKKLLELSDGASDDDYNAYSYMALPTQPPGRCRSPATNGPLA